MRPGLIIRLASIRITNISLTLGVLSSCTMWCNGFDLKFLRNLEDSSMFFSNVGGNPLTIHGVKTQQTII
jgi:hypothetical protein